MVIRNRWVIEVFPFRLVTRNRFVIAFAKLFPFLLITRARVGTDVSSYFEVRFR